MDLLTKVRGIDILQVIRDLGYELHQHRKILCPFHAEKTPSLVLYPQNNSYYCFGCGRHGDVVNFYAGVTGQEYRTALHDLAGQYLPDYQPRPFPRTDGPAAPRKKPLLKPAGNELKGLPPDTKTYVYKPLHSDIYEDFQRVCSSQPDNEVGREAREYLLSRGFSDITLRQFRLFTVNEYDTAQAYLRNNYGLLDLQESGLFNEKGNLIFYRHPILIPYYRKGRIVYLQGRVIGSPPEKVSRYQFLSGVPVELFNADVLSVLKTGRMVYLTEGAFDCMTLVQEGIPAVSLGSATMFKKEWIKLFQRFEVCFIFDNDTAGQKAAQEFSELFTRHRISTQIRTVKEGFKDVNEYYTRRNRQ
ncbi:CHC2 zinc finger domain-containing protein [Larkinella soli]|uniref:CHC2 zinc finger domain-containing protein n=1 Tax=Larkinella soli TaxID=1770527 RepID=UPI000FFBDA8D|nr:CHC2 zinc finger domain-containing protein [Larkinella soli]